jgi:hypothetical protein
MFWQSIPSKTSKNNMCNVGYLIAAQMLQSGFSAKRQRDIAQKQERKADLAEEKAKQQLKAEVALRQPSVKGAEVVSDAPGIEGDSDAIRAGLREQFTISGGTQV